MAGKRKTIMEMRQIIQFKQKGYSNRRVAELLNIHRNTVNSYVKLIQTYELSYDELLGLDDASLREFFPEYSAVTQSRYEVLAGYFPYFDKELKKPGCTLLTLWKEYKQQHPDGYQYAQFVLHFNRWRKTVKGSTKLEHRFGEELMVDFTGKKLPYVDPSTGEMHEAEMFAGILPASQFTFVMAVSCQDIEHFIHALSHCLHYLGGVPLVIIPDNLKSAVNQPSRHTPMLNDIFRDFACHYGCSVDPARPYKPKDKALVENAVNLVYQRIFYPLQKHTFFSVEEINQAITPLLQAYNRYRFRNKNSSRNEEFQSLEKPYLQALPSAPYKLKYFKRLTVQHMGHIYLPEDKHYYSAPYQYIGKRVRVEYTCDTVELFFRGERIATHKRDRRPGRYTTLEHHRSQAHQNFTARNRAYYSRQAGQKIGPNVQQYICRLIDQYNYPEQGYKQAHAILRLRSQYDSRRMEQAASIALEFPRYSYQTIANILYNRYDQQQQSLLDEDSGTMPDHSNKRGKQAYR